MNLVHLPAISVNCGRTHDMQLPALRPLREPLGKSASPDWQVMAGMTVRLGHWF